MRRREIWTTSVTERMVGALDGQLNLDVGRIDKIKLLTFIHDAKTIDQKFSTT